MIARLTLMSVLLVTAGPVEAQVSRKSVVNFNPHTATSSMSQTTVVYPTRGRSNLSFTGVKRGRVATQLPAQAPNRTWGRRYRGYPQAQAPVRRPIVNNQTVVNRPAVQNIVNNINNVTTINNNQQTVINNNYGNQNVYTNQNVNYGNRNFNYGNQNIVNPRPWRGYYDHLHAGWHTGYWNFAYQPSIWVAGTNGLSWATSAGTGYTFVNPYYNSAVVLGGVDYSHPIRPAYSDPYQVSGSVTEEAIRRLNAAREAFRQQSYRRSLDLVESAIRLLPDDPVLHELRALNLFALGDYERAAAVIYPVLAAGPGSDWSTMAALYASSNVYVAQLTNLAQFIARNPNNAAARFLLAYHLLVVGQPKDAYIQLREVLLIRPNDTVARELVRALEQS